MLQSAALNKPSVDELAVTISTVMFGPTVEEDPPVMVMPDVEVETLPLV